MTTAARLIVNLYASSEPLGVLHVVQAPLPEAVNGLRRPEPKALLSKSIPRRDEVDAVCDHK